MDRKGRNKPHPREYSVLYRAREALDKAWLNPNTVDRYVIDNPRNGTLVVMSFYPVDLPFDEFEGFKIIYKKVELK